MQRSLDRPVVPPIGLRLPAIMRRAPLLRPLPVSIQSLQRDHAERWTTIDPIPGFIGGPQDRRASGPPFPDIDRPRRLPISLEPNRAVPV